ncbi:MAG: CDP-diacylglycerol--glycerol-3-phosphate 3-phosphatidyltransferase [Eubacterium sp.]|nr:CDP-diacylglycerol--glycerol-3-phosphate 3-phosphatidyltransferase [Eubacterium sp.]
MNLPNKLTCLRMIMIPFFVIFMYLPQKWAGYVALIIFIAASLTDTADGYIARKYNLITDFGKFMDPLADKLLVCSALILFAGNGRIPAFVVVIIISREFIISGFRLIAADNGLVIAASYWGKAKTISQMVMIIVLLLAVPGWRPFEIVLITIATALTVISLLDYLIKNKSVLGNQK